MGLVGGEKGEDFDCRVSASHTDVADSSFYPRGSVALGKKFSTNVCKREKERKVAEAQQIYAINANSVLFHREILIDSRGVDSKDMFHTPDNTVVI